jgi:hypothetical protein
VLSTRSDRPSPLQAPGGKPLCLCLCPCSTEQALLRSTAVQSTKPLVIQCNALYWRYGPLGRRERSELRAAKPLAQHRAVSGQQLASSGNPPPPNRRCIPHVPTPKTPRAGGFPEVTAPHFPCVFVIPNEASPSQKLAALAVQRAAGPMPSKPFIDGL